MPDQDFHIPSAIVKILVVTNIVIPFLGVYADFQDWESTRLLYVSMNVSFILTCGILVIDIIKHNIYNKLFWILSMIIFPAIAPVIYLIRRSSILSSTHRFSESD